MKRLLILVALGGASALGACATSPERPRPSPNIYGQTEDVDVSSNSYDDPRTFRGAAMETGRNLPNAAAAPLRDFNLMQEDIPPLLSGLEYPYRVPHVVSCEDILAEVRALNTVLGPDSDIADEQLSFKERRVEEATNAANNALEDVASGWIPYRSIVRRITGATEHERNVRKAYERGRLRRAFLKGLGMAQHCEYPAAPAHLVDPVPYEGNWYIRPQGE